jgi:hypothetical protein
LFSWPAWEEYQLLVALAADVTPLEGPRLPMKFRVAPEWVVDVKATLQGICLAIQEQERPFPS